MSWRDWPWPTGTGSSWPTAVSGSAGLSPSRSSRTCQVRLDRDGDKPADPLTAVGQDEPVPVGHGQSRQLIAGAGGKYAAVGLGHLVGPAPRGAVGPALPQ